MRLHLLSPLILLGLLFSFSTSAQQLRKCAANEVMEAQIARMPSFAANMIAIEKHTQEFVAAKKAAAENKSNVPGTKGKPDKPGGGTPPPPPPAFTPVTIPVVVHVLYNSTSQNIAQARVTEQVNILNADFAYTNSDKNSYIPVNYTSVVSQGADISFCLVQTKRVPTSVASFSTNDAMKYSSSGGSDAVDPSKYLNIWVCNMGGGILGYAQFPGGNPATDGIVILYSAFGNTSGNYDLGRTATHEVGHYFNLRHIWGDRRCGNDYVDDTPLHDAANYGCPAQGATSNCKGPVVEMWMNYMDYTYDKCMYMFSEGQATRMQATLSAGGPRYGMVQSNACTALPATVNSRNGEFLESDLISLNTKSFKLYPTITSGNVFMHLKSSHQGVAELAVYNEAGIMITRKRIPVSEGINLQEINLGNLSNGIYLAKIREGNHSHIQKLVVQH